MRWKLQNKPKILWQKIENREITRLLKTVDKF